MRLSARRQSALYAAISDPVFALRLRAAAGAELDRRALDRELFELKREVVARVWTALGIEDPPPDT